MTIYTTYFAKLKSLPVDVVPISICGKAPPFYKGIQYKKLAPRIGFFMQWKADNDNERFSKCYRKEVLAELQADAIIKELSELSEGKDIALVCYEKSEDFCHRHLVAEWLVENGKSVEEWTAEKKEI